MNSSATSTPEALKKPRFGAQIQAFFQQDRRKLLLLYACVLAVVCTTIDPPFYALTSQEVQAFLRETTSSAPLTVAVEFLLIAVMTLAGGTMGDLYGRRRLLVIGLGVICAMNVLGAFTLDLPIYQTFHRLNVVAGAVVLSMCVAIVALAFDAALRPFAFGMLFGLRSVAVVVSSTFSYWFERWGVRWLSFMPVIVLSIIAIVLVFRFVQESTAGVEGQKSLAFVNLLLLGIVFVTAFLILSAVSLLNNMLLVLLTILTLGLIGATVRWWVQRRKNYTANAIFSSRDVAIAIIAGMLISGIQGAFLFEYWTFNAEVLGFNWFFNALRVAPYMVGLLLGSVMVLQVLQRLGVRGTLAGGMLLMAGGLLIMSLIRPDTPYVFMLLPIFVMGIGFGLATPVRAQVVLSAPPSNLIGASAAVNNATGQLGYALGIAISSSFVMRLADASMLGTLQDAGIDPATIDKIVAALPDYATRAAQATYAVLPQAAEIVPIDYASAWTAGLSNLFLAFGLAMLIGAVVVFFVKSNMQLPAQQPPAGE